MSPITRAQEGDWAVREMERLHVDVSVVCPAGISIERGLTQATRRGRRVAGRGGLRRTGDRASRCRQLRRLRLRPVRLGLDQIDSIAVAGSPSEAALQPFVERGITITVGGTS